VAVGITGNSNSHELGVSHRWQRGLGIKVGIGANKNIEFCNPIKNFKEHKYETLLANGIFAADEFKIAGWRQ